MHRFTHGRLSVAYRESGSGPAILMLHNGGTSSTIWRNQLDALSDRRHAVALDLPGFGESPRVTPPPDLREMVELVAAFIEAHGLAPVMLVGNCMGSNIAAGVATADPDRVAAMLLVNPLTEATFSSGGLGVFHRMGKVAARPTRLLRSAVRRLPQYVGNIKHGAWQQSGLKAASMPPNFGIGMVLKGRTLGIWGYGHIGKLVAAYGRAFGMKVVIWGSEASRLRASADGYAAAESLEAFFEACDVLSLHLRLNDATRAIVKLSDLSRMKPTALLVNTSRAELIEEGALVGALNRGRPGMAAVDVFESEPVLQGQPLLRLENAVCTPHIGYVEQDNYELLFNAAFDNVVNFIAGNPTNIVNPEALRIPR